MFVEVVKPPVDEAVAPPTWLVWLYRVIGGLYTVIGLPYTAALAGMSVMACDAGCNGLCPAIILIYSMFALPVISAVCVVLIFLWASSPTWKALYAVLTPWAWVVITFAFQFLLDWAGFRFNQPIFSGLLVGRVMA